MVKETPDGKHAVIDGSGKTVSSGHATRSEAEQAQHHHALERGAHFYKGAASQVPNATQAFQGTGGADPSGGGLMQGTPMIMGETDNGGRGSM